MRLLHYLKLATLPLFLAAVVLSLFLVRAYFSLPTEEQLRPLALDLYSRFGLLVVLLAGFLEGILVIGWYFPGTTIILLCLLLISDRPTEVALIAATASVGLWLAYAINYMLGRYGWYTLLARFGMSNAIEKAKARLQSHGMAAIIFSYWQFTLASLTSTAAGVLSLPFARFLMLSLIATLFWVGAWSTLIVSLGSVAMTLVGLPFILILIACWLIAILIHRLISRDMQ